MHTLRVFARKVALLGSITGMLTGCSASDLVNTEVPAGTNDPKSFDTREGAQTRYRGVINQFRRAVGGGEFSYVAAGGLLGDELDHSATGFFGSIASSISMLDSRNVDEVGLRASGFLLEQGISVPWTALHKVRITAIDAIGALRKYAPGAPDDQIGHMFALEGMAEVMLAELYCSGIPLSTIDFEGVHHAAAASTSAQVYEHAIQLFDSAFVHTPDSVAYRHLATVGKGWALLGLGRFTDAAATVQGVPTDFVYQNLYSAVPEQNAYNFTYTTNPDQPSTNYQGSMADGDGSHGLYYRSENDPRVPWVRSEGGDGPFGGGAVYYFAPLVTPANGAGPVIVASGIEARLIEAEADLQSNGATWLSTLNVLRERVPGLAPLDNPGTPAARVDTLFKERAFWLYLTGRRLGDMRRLVRQYGRSIDAIFPGGAYSKWPTGVYGTAVNLLPPPNEQRANPNYHGCFNRDA